MSEPRAWTGLGTGVALKREDLATKRVAIVGLER
jgi:hypothetical protein